MRASLLLLFFIITFSAYGQQVIISGKVVDESGKSIPEVNISVKGEPVKGTFTEGSGSFNLSIPKTNRVILLFSHINYISKTDTVFISADTVFLNIVLQESSTLLNEISIIDEREREQVSITKIKGRSFEEFPSPFQDISRVLISLPGVVSNNELSGSYSVRGGNFDENLVFVEGIPIYRPQITSNGQQEGLGFVNTTMIDEVTFSAGGWRANYGDKLSSVLEVDYIEPQKFLAKSMVGLLGGSATIGSKIGNTSFIAGVRHKNSRYLLNTLETQGEYFPQFTDFQFFTKSKLSNKTALIALGGYAKNRYEVFPATRETEFGTFNIAYRLTVGFEGKDLLEYDTYQGGLKLIHNWNKSFTSSLIISGVKTSEREYTEVEGGYRLCDVNKNIGSPGFNECLVIRGIGTLYDHRRNYLKGEQYLIEGQTELQLSSTSNVSGGIGWSFEKMDDRLSEFNFIDSAGFVTELEGINQANSLERSRLNGFTSWNKESNNHNFTAGVRFNYRQLNSEFAVSPRFQYSYTPDWKNDVVVKVATGIYRQTPIFREFRGFDGLINKDLKMQSAWHIITGLDHNLELWDRPFKFISEVYYKYLWNVNSYEVDNVRIRYFGKNNATAYAYGADLRLSGEFIKNTESWFSLGILSTKEKLQGDGSGYLRRPMDQRVTAAIFFQDQLPDNPDFHVNVHVQFGSGLPFGPPNDIERRSVFRGDAYRRVDIGFSKVFKNIKEIQEFTITAEILNLTGSQNVISYIWIEDVFNRQFAVPNTLSARFFNVRLSISL